MTGLIYCEGCVERCHLDCLAEESCVDRVEVALKEGVAGLRNSKGKLRHYQVKVKEMSIQESDHNLTPFKIILILRCNVFS